MRCFSQRTQCALTYIDNWYAAGQSTAAYEQTHALLSENMGGEQVTILGVDVDCKEKTPGNKVRQKHPFHQGDNEQGNDIHGSLENTRHRDEARPSRRKAVARQLFLTDTGSSKTDRT
jgi:hypothetical protein